jgi:hypothetical protein
VNKFLINESSKLSASEVRVCLAAIALKLLGLRITSENIYKVTGMHLQYIRNILRALYGKGFLKPSSPPRIYSLMSSSSGRVKEWELNISIEDFASREEVLDFVRKIEEEDLRASSKEELLEKLKNLKNTKLGKRIMEKLSKET